MVSSDIWMGSGATVSMIPEKELHLGTFASIAGASDNRRVITLNSTFTTNFSLVANLYRGCYLNIYTVSGNVFTDRVLIQGNAATTLTVNDSLLAAITTTATNYYGVIEQYGAPVPAPKGASSGALGSVVVGTAGTNVTANLAILDNTELLAGALDDGTGGEVQLTISAHSTVVTFATVAATNYEDGDADDDGSMVFTIVGTTGNETVGIVFNDSDEGAKASGASRDITIAVTTGDDGSTVAQAVLLALEDEDLTISRNANVLTVTNQVGGLGATTTEDTNGGVTITTTTAGGAITAATINTAGSGFTAGGAYAIGNGEITITPTAAGNPRLLSDTWIGLANSISIPDTSIETTQMNLVAGGTRNFQYQYKGVETTGNGSINLMANSFWPLYYALGKKSISSIAAAETSHTPTNQFTLASGSGTSFIYSETEDSIHRTEGTKICPPLTTGATLSNHLLINNDDVENDFITYDFSEENGQVLPSFALEYTLKKADQTATVATDSAKENVYTKIYPGTVVGSLGMAGDVNGPVTMDLSLSHKNTFVADANYDTFNGVTDVKEFVNYRGRQGQTETLASDSDADTEPLMRPFFFADGTISMFGQDYIRLSSFNLNIENSLQPQRYIGRYDKNSQTHLTGQRTYSLSFTGHVTDAAVFNELQSQLATALSSATSEIVLRFTKENGEELQMKFRDYMVTQATFPVADGRGPVEVTWTIQPLTLEECSHTTYWAIQG